MNSKKAITLLVLATLLMSLVPVISVNAIAVTTVLNENDVVIGVGDKIYYDDVIKVIGTGATPGRNVNVYWDAIDAWNGESGLLNTTKAEGNGDYEIWFTVPEAVNGDHWISVENARTTEDALWGTALEVDAKIELSPGSGLKDESVTINGYGYDSEVDIVGVTFNGTPVTTSPATPETNDLGSWSATFQVPDLAYAVYPVVATDASAFTNTTTFEIGASISLSKVEGPSGTVVRISGRGFTAEAGISNGTITYNGVDCGIITENVKVRNNAQTTFTIDVVIPVTAVGEHDLVVTESGVGPNRQADAEFDLNGNAAIEFTPEYGPVGSTITVKGYNFTQINGEEVILKLAGIGDTTVETNSNGEFTANFRIPGAAGTVPMTAEQADYNILGQKNFRVGFITVVVNPEEVTSGALVSVSGSGFVAGRAWNVTLDGDLWIDNPAVVTVNGVITAEENVPSIAPGVYDVVVTEDVSGISVAIELTVTENTYVTTSPLVSPARYNVTIEGYNFAEGPLDPTLTFVLYNETNEWDLDVMKFGGNVVLEADPDWDDGYFEGTFLIPEEDDISVGSYTLNVTDGEGMWTQYAFDVVDKTVGIEPKKSIFRIGETLGFNVESSFAQDDSYIKIWDPSSNLYWQTDVFDNTAPNNVWVSVGTIERVPYYEQVAGGNPMTFLEDAPLGTWTWTWYDFEDEELDTGSFTVEAAEASVIGEQVADLNNQITDLASQLDGVTEDFNDVKSDIADVAAIAEEAVTAAQQAAEAVQTVAQTANTASQAAADAADAANAARDAANGLTTLVYGAIGASLVAALAAIVSLMQISRRIAG